MLINIFTFNSVCLEPPPFLFNGRYNGPEIQRSGSIYNYECNPRFELSPGSSKYAICTTNGTYRWEDGGSYPLCIPSSFNNFL